MSQQQPLPPPQPLPPAGWYPDPEGRDGQRYWTGATWTAFMPAVTAKPTTNWKALIVIGGVVAAIVIGGIFFGHGDRARPTMPDPGSWYQVHADTAGLWETVGPKNDGQCHWLRASKPSEDLENWIDVGQWDLNKTTGGTMKIQLNAGEYFMYWGCYPFHFVG